MAILQKFKGFFGLSFPQGVEKLCGKVEKYAIL